MIPDLTNRQQIKTERPANVSRSRTQKRAIEDTKNETRREALEGEGTPASAEDPEGAMEMEDETQREQERTHWYLNKIPLLQGLRKRDWERLQNAVTMQELSRRTVVYLPGDPGEGVYFVNGGRVKVSKVTRDGREITLFYLGPGEIFGENSLFDEAPRNEMVETADDSLITMVPKKLVEKFLSRGSKQFLLEVFKVVSQRRREVEQRMQHLLFRDVNAKLAELILDLSKEYGVEEPDGVRVALKITHQEMANLIGSTRETVSLTLSQFRKKGLIRLHRRQVIILDERGLTALL